MSRGARVVGARPRVGGARAPVVAEVGHLKVRVGAPHLGAHWNGAQGMLDGRLQTEEAELVQGRQWCRHLSSTSHQHKRY